MNLDHREVQRWQGEQLPTPMSVFVSGQLPAAPVKDLSPAGMGLLLQGPATPGAVLGVELPNRAGGPWRLKQLQIKHATPCGKDAWFVGGAFLQRLTDAEFSAVLGVAAAGVS